MPALDYPSHLVEDWQLSDGTPVRIRPIRADDLDLHTAFVAGLSSETGYRRLLSPRKPQPDELWRMTHIDYDRELALIATTVVDGAEQQMGVVRYVRGETPETTHIAEFAVVIGDAWQHRGVAMKLMRKLIDAAAEAGVKQLADITLYDNAGMLALARKLGFRLQRDPGDPKVTRLRLALDAPARRGNSLRKQQKPQPEGSQSFTCPTSCPRGAVASTASTPASPTGDSSVAN